MRLYKQGNSPYWWMDIKVGRKRIRRSTKRLHSDKRGAQRVMAQEYERLMNKGQFGDKPEITLSEAFDVTLDEVEGQTHRIYQSSFKVWNAAIGGTTLLSSVTTEDVDHFVAQRRKAGLKPNSIRSNLKTLQRVMNRVQTTHKVNRDIAWPKIGTFTKSRYLSEAEEAAVLKKLQSEASENVTADKAYRLCLFLLDTGMRLQEAIDIEWSDIDVTNMTIEVYRSKTKTVSVVPLSDRVRLSLEPLEGQERPFEKMEWAVRFLRKAIHAVCNKNDRQVEARGKATIHSLRDTYASRMLKRGISIYKLSKLLGHTSAAMSEKYGHLEVHDVVEEARRLMAR